MDLTARIIVGVLSAAFLVAYFAWRWRRAGLYVDNQAAQRERAKQYFEALKLDPRYQALEAEIRARHPLGDGADPASFHVEYAGLVDDQGFMYRIDNAVGPTRIAALIVRKEPAAQKYVSMSLATREVREDDAPHGWTYVGPPR